MIASRIKTEDRSAQDGEPGLKPKARPSAEWWPWAGMGLILLVTSLLALARLDHTPFWNDESFVAICARNFVSFGHLTSWDGRNLYAEGNGNFTDAHFRNGNPPLDILAAAASFRVFGVSTWAGRLPFALFGLGSLALFWAILRREFPGKPALWLYSLASLAFSCEFLLNVRACRYYALGLFFSLLTFACYRRCLRTRRMADFAGLAAAATLLFYSHYLLCAAFLLALISLHLLFHRRDFSPGDWGKAAGAAALFALAVGPYLAAFPIWSYHATANAIPEPWFPNRPILVARNLAGLNLIGAMPWTVLLALGAVFVRCRCSESVVRQAAEWAALGFGFTVFLGLLTPTPVALTDIADLRYLIPAAPLMAGLTGVLLWVIHRRMPLVAVTLLLLLVTTNIATFGVGTDGFRWLLPAFVQEMIRPYPTANAEAASFLRANAQQDDVVLACPQYLNYPLLFYVGDKVRIGCILDRKTPLPLDRVERLNAPLLVDTNFPNWVILFGAQGGAGPLLDYFSRPHTELGRQRQYAYRPVKLLNVFWNQTQRPELPWHTFGPPKDYDPRSQAVMIFQRTDVPQPQSRRRTRAAAFSRPVVRARRRKTS